MKLNDRIAYMDFHEIEENVMAWAKARGIYEHSNPAAQLMKLVSEVGELADAVVKNQDEETLDAVGDILVCLVNFCAFKNYTVTNAFEVAYRQIKDRKGRMMPGGVFVKEDKE